MTTPQHADRQIDVYMGRLDRALAGFPPGDQQDILREIRIHIVESASGAPDHDAAVERVLRLLGTPEQLAGRYRTEHMLSRASRSFSPWFLLQTCWQWARSGVKGMVAFFVVLIGYGLALGFTVSVFLKPWMPRIGWWSGPEGFGIILPDHPERMHELLGNYFVPVIAAAAFLSAISTTQLLRRMMRKRAPGLVPVAGTVAP